LLLSIGLGKLVGRSGLPSGCTISDGTFTSSTVGWDLEDAVYVDSSSIFNGVAIGTIVSIAHKVLGGQSIRYNSRLLSASDIADILDNINQANDDCTSNGHISPVRCGNLVVAHAQISYSDSDNIGSRATVTCASGYSLSSTTRPTCSLSGSGSGVWIDVPTCETYRCGSLTVAYGQVSLSNSDYVGSQATVVCSAGYVLSSTTRATCTLDESCTSASWTNVPTCIALRCGPIAVAYGSISLSNSDLVGSAAIITCNNGYAPGNRPICLQSGNTAAWSCAATCSRVYCPALTTSSYISSISYSTSAPYPVGGQVTVVCTGTRGTSTATCSQASVNAQTAAWVGLPSCAAPEEAAPLEAQNVPVPSKSPLTPPVIVGLSVGVLAFIVGLAIAFCLRKRSNTLEQLDSKLADPDKGEVEVTMM
jgi:hypothetical protein